MRTAQEWLTDPRMAAALDDLRAAQWLLSSDDKVLAASENPDGLYLISTVDVDDPDPRTIGPAA